MKYIYPEKCSKKLTKIHINQWREKGYLLVDNILEDNILHNAIKELNIIYPNFEDKDKVNIIASKQDFGSKGKLEFPCTCDSINQITSLLILLMFLQNSLKL